MIGQQCGAGCTIPRVTPLSHHGQEIPNPFEGAELTTVPYEMGTCKYPERGQCMYYDPTENLEAYQSLARQLLNEEVNIEYVAAILEEGALTALARGETPSAFISVLWYKHSTVEYQEIKDMGAYANIGTTVLDDVSKALSAWGRTTIWDKRSWDMEPQLNRLLFERFVEETIK
jgi:hypothetical protein